jgi:nitrile hydratase accessory protein
LSTTDPELDPERPASLPPLPHEGDGPVFGEPWQALAFALAVQLSKQGCFTWKEWASALADELKSAADRGQPDDGSRYYEHSLTALERLITEKNLSNRKELLARKDAWANAYRHTPHGKPVELERGGSRRA